MDMNRAFRIVILWSLSMTSVVSMWNRFKLTSAHHSESLSCHLLTAAKGRTLKRNFVETQSLRSNAWTSNPRAVAFSTRGCARGVSPQRQSPLASAARKSKTFAGLASRVL
jgi:hypothetical protein